EQAVESSARRLRHWSAACLEHYAAFLLHESPTLDRRSELEFPTETWAAQDFRKVVVMMQAERFLPVADARALRGRARALYDRAWQDLNSFPTRHCTRALALVLTEATTADELLRRPLEPEAVPADVPGELPPTVGEFIPQKQRLKESLRRPKAAVVAAGRLLQPHRWWRVWTARRAMRRGGSHR
ncbi:MAG: hypothetical protein ACRDD1_08060, partial [Planctomycetia bacterium]